MKALLFTVTHSFDHRDDGITVCPGVPADMMNTIEGAHLVCERPDGKTASAVVSAISHLCQFPDERLALCLTGELTIDDVPVDTNAYLEESSTGTNKSHEGTCNSADPQR